MITRDATELRGAEIIVIPPMHNRKVRRHCFPPCPLTMKPVRVDVKIEGQDGDIEIVRPEVRVA